MIRCTIEVERCDRRIEVIRDDSVTGASGRGDPIARLKAIVAATEADAVAAMQAKSEGLA